MSLLKVKNYSVLCLDIDLNYWNILSLVMSSNNLNTTAFQSDENGGVLKSSDGCYLLNHIPVSIE